MRFLTFFGKLRSRRPLVVRRVVGNSMEPSLKPGQIIFGSGLLHVQPGSVVVIRHDGKEKIKRVHSIEHDRLFLLGDNPPSSTDSRHFGWVDSTAVEAVVLVS